MSDDKLRESLPDDSENYDVFCERCQRVHSYYSMTKQQYDRLVSHAAVKLADRIDLEAFDYVMKRIYGR